MAQDFGTFLGLKSERIQVRKGKETLQELRLNQVEQVVLTGRGRSLSTDLLAECAERGIPIHVLTAAGKPAMRSAS